MNPPGSETAFTSLPFMTLNVHGSPGRADAAATRRPMTRTRSVIAGSWTTPTSVSSCWAAWRPRLISCVSLISAASAGRDCGVRRVLIELNGSVVTSFPTGDFPHENQYSPDGTRILNGSIGRVIAPDDPLLDAGKGNRWLTIADAATKQVVKTIDFGVGIRPFVVMPDNNTLYVQLSFRHGFVEYDLARERITREVDLPLSEEARSMKREDYPLDSAHHGLALGAGSTKLCDAGTVSDYAAIVSLPALTTDAIVPVGAKPYWAAATPDGRFCFLSNSDSDDVSVVSFDSAREVARIPVGDHPQRVRAYIVPADALSS